MSEYYIVVKPFSIGKDYIYKSNARLEAEWLKNQLKQLKHKVAVERTAGGP